MCPPSTQLEWYRQGNWPLAGAILLLVLTQGITLGLAIYATTASLRRELLLHRITAYSEQLFGFYNPLLSLILANKAVFDDFNPKTFPDNEIERETAAKVWAALKKGVILPNNEGILGILREKSHLVTETDDIEVYSSLFNHIVMYMVFVEYRTEQYKTALSQKTGRPRDGPALNGAFQMRRLSPHALWM
jgi:hypothetical protein